MDFEDFMESRSAIVAGMPIQSCSGQFSPSKTCVSEAFEEVSTENYVFSTLSGRFGVVEITGCDHNQQNVENY